MDNDNKTDIVTLDDSGLIHIFYGGGTSQEPSFTKLKVGDGYGITLSESTTNYGGAVYFDGVDAVSPDGEYLDLITSMEEYEAEMEAALANGDEVEAAIFGQYLVERLLFVPLPYIPYVYDGTPEEQLLDALDDSIPNTNYEDLNAQLATAS